MKYATGNPRRAQRLWCTRRAVLIAGLWTLSDIRRYATTSFMLAPPLRFHLDWTAIVQLGMQPVCVKPRHILGGCCLHFCQSRPCATFRDKHGQEKHNERPPHQICGKRPPSAAAATSVPQKRVIRRIIMERYITSRSYSPREPIT